LKLPRDLSGREVVRALKRLGFLQSCQKGCTSDFRKLVCAYLFQTILTCVLNTAKHSRTSTYHHRGAEIRSLSWLFAAPHDRRESV